MPDGVETTVLSMRSADGARVPGVLYHVPGARTAVTLMHPRLDLSRHYLTSLLCATGLSVFVQGTRSVGNDVTLVHEQALLDAAAGFRRVRELGFDNVVACGPSGGAALYAFYLQQSSLPPGDRLERTPGGHPTGLAGAEMPVPDGVAFVAPHEGQGELLLGCIDPSVADELDPRSTVAELDLFSPANGFRPAPESSSYSEEFLARYRAAQRARVARIDARAQELLAARAGAAQRWRSDERVEDRRRSMLAEVIAVYRTDADPRTVALSLDPSDRPYGSVHGSRPDLGNFGLAGFGRLSTPEAWLSTWSAFGSNAGFRRCGPGVRVPTLMVEYTGDQATFPTVAEELFRSIGAEDKTHERVAGTHFGGSTGPDEPLGGIGAAKVISAWIAARFDVA